MVSTKTHKKRQVSVNDIEAYFQKGKMKSIQKCEHQELVDIDFLLNIIFSSNARESQIPCLVCSKSGIVICAHRNCCATRINAYCKNPQHTFQHFKHFPYHTMLFFFTKGVLVCSNCNTKCTLEQLISFKNHSLETFKPELQQTSDYLSLGQIGLLNLGNTCYFNACIQLLVHCNPFSNYFLQIELPKDEGGPEHLSVTEILSRYIKLMRNPKSPRVVNPLVLLRCVRDKTTGFSPHVQHDAQEFLRAFIDVIHTEIGVPIYQSEFEHLAEKIESISFENTEQSCSSFLAMPNKRIAKKLTKKNIKKSNLKLKKIEDLLSEIKKEAKTESDFNELQFISVNSDKVDEKNENFNIERPIFHQSIITELFEGVFKSTIKCTNCHSQSCSIENFLDLSLPLTEEIKFNQGVEQEIANSEWITLEKCLDSYFEKTTLQGDNCYFCEKCNKLVVGVKSIEILKSPNVLCIHLKRFRHEHGRSTKINSFVDFPFDLNMNNYCKNIDNNCYKLSGFVVHDGALEAGHYRTYSHNKFDKNWYEFDDFKVNHSDIESVKSQQAYLMMYVKTNTLSSVLDMNPQDTCYISKEWWNNLHSLFYPGPIDNNILICQKHQMLLPFNVPDNQLVIKANWEIFLKLQKLYGGGPVITSLKRCPTCDFKINLEEIQSKLSKASTMNENRRADLASIEIILKSLKNGKKRKWVPKSCEHIDPKLCKIFKFVRQQLSQRFGGFHKLSLLLGLLPKCETDSTKYEKEITTAVMAEIEYILDLYDLLESDSEFILFSVYDYFLGGEVVYDTNDENDESTTDDEDDKENIIRQSSTSNKLPIFS